MRVLVRVPEAYSLLVPYEAVRPGLLLLDADGRRVGCLPLEAGPKGVPDAAAVARFLGDGAKGPALERFRLKVGPAEAAPALAEAAKKGSGVERAEATGESLFVVARPGTFSPEVVAGLAESAKAAVEILEPVPVAFTAAASADRPGRCRDLAGVAGTWYAAVEGDRIRAWVTALLLDPAKLEAALEGPSDLEVRRFALPGVSTGPAGMKIAPAARGVAGVLAVFPALDAESLTVVGRRDGIAWPGVLAALRATGVTAREEAK